MAESAAAASSAIESSEILDVTALPEKKSVLDEIDDLDAGWVDTPMYDSIANMGLATSSREDHVLHFLADVISGSSLPAPWAMFRDENKRPFYGNRETEETSWSHPLVETLHELACTCRVVASLSPLMRENCVANLRDTWLSAMKREFALWYAVPDNESGRDYYVNSQTGATMWDHPVEVLLPAHYMKLQAADLLMDEAYVSRLLQEFPVQSTWSPAGTLGNWDSSSIAAEGSFSKAKSIQDGFTDDQAFASTAADSEWGRPNTGKVHQELAELAARHDEVEERAQEYSDLLKKTQERMQGLEQEAEKFQTAAAELEKERSRTQQIDDERVAAEQNAQQTAALLKEAQLKLDTLPAQPEDVQKIQDDYIKMSSELDTERAHLADVATELEDERNYSASIVASHKQVQASLESAAEAKEKQLRNTSAQLEEEKRLSSKLDGMHSRAEASAQEAAQQLREKEVKMEERAKQDAEVLTDVATGLQHHPLARPVNVEDTQLFKELEAERARFVELARKRQEALRRAHDTTFALSRAQDRMAKAEAKQKKILKLAMMLEAQESAAMRASQLEESSQAQLTLAT